MQVSDTSSSSGEDVIIEGFEGYQHPSLRLNIFCLPAGIVSDIHDGAHKNCVLLVFYDGLEALHVNFARHLDWIHSTPLPRRPCPSLLWFASLKAFCMKFYTWCYATMVCLTSDQWDRREMAQSMFQSQQNLHHRRRVQSGLIGQPILWSNHDKAGVSASWI